MISLISADASDRFRIFLNDHRALFAAEQSLAERSHQANADTELGSLLGTVVEQSSADQAALDSLLQRADGTPNAIKKFAAIVGQQFGRLKLNGQLTGYSPLSRVIEVEALVASTAVRAATWNAIAAMAISDDVTSDAQLRAETADEQHGRLGEHHVEAVLAAFEVGS